MLGSIIGDIIGSRFEFNNIHTKDFELFDKTCRFTDDSIMTLAVLKSLLECKDNHSKLKFYFLEYRTKLNMRLFYRYYPQGRAYGIHFKQWLKDFTKGPYNSCGNGAAMRISPVAYFAKSEDEVKELSKTVTEITHNHPEGIKGAECISLCIYKLLNGATKDDIKLFVEQNYYDLPALSYLQETKTYFDAVCQQTVPEAITCFLESNSFEDAIRNAISIGGDSDTLAAITGSLAEAYYDIPIEITKKALSYLDGYLLSIIIDYFNYKEEKEK